MLSIRRILFLFLLILGLILLLFCSVFAADSGTCGSCAWNVTDGILTLYPVFGACCDLDASCCDGSHAAWAGREDIFSVVLNGTINAGSFAGSMFYGLPNLASVFGMKNLVIGQVATGSAPAEPTETQTMEVSQNDLIMKTASALLQNMTGGESALMSTGTPASQTIQNESAPVSNMIVFYAPEVMPTVTPTPYVEQNSPVADADWVITRQPKEIPAVMPTEPPVYLNAVSTDILNAQRGDHIYYGHYEQDNNVNTTNEPIEWWVLDRKDNRIFLVSAYALARGAFDEKDATASWKNCTLRQWLNSSFYNEAFTFEEQSRIVENTDGDKVSLLSIEDVTTYFGDTPEYLKCRMSRAAAWHEWNSYNGSSENNIYIRWWWLRPVHAPEPKDRRNVQVSQISQIPTYLDNKKSGNSAFRAPYVSEHGVIVNSSSASVTMPDGGIRPAFWLQL